MAGRGVGRGTGFGRGIRFEALPDSGATGAAPTAGRTFPVNRAAAQPPQPDLAVSAGNLAITTHTPGRTGKDGTERRARGDFDPNRPSYRIPKRFKDNFTSDRQTLKFIEDAGGKGGSEGAKVALKANYFHIRSDKALTYTVAVFSVQFTPIIEFRQERLSILRDMVAMKKINLGFFYDGKADLFMPTQYHKSLLDGVQLIEEEYHHLRQGKVTLVFRGNYGHVKETDDNKLGTAHGVINDVLSEILTGDDCKNMMLRIEDGFFRKGEESDISGIMGVPYKLKVWPGYLPLAKQFDAGLLLNLDLCSRFLRTGTVLDAIKRIPGNVGSDEHAQNCEAILKNMIVLTKYTDQAYKIFEVTYKESVDSKFERKVVGKNKQGIYSEASSSPTIREYIKSMYGAKPDMDIRTPSQPILKCTRASGQQLKKVKGEKPETVSIVPELALLTGLTDELRTNFSNMNKILDSVRKEPGRRGEICRKFAIGLSEHPDAKKKMAAWALTMDVNLLDLQGRELPTVQLAQAGNKTVAYDRVDADWTRNLRGNKLDEAGVMNKITVLYSSNDEKKAGDFYSMLDKVGSPMGMRFGKPDAQGLSGDAASFKKSVENMKPADMLLCVLPDNKKLRYEGIKQAASNGHGMPSQCILSKNVDSKSAMSIATKLAMQMNAKLGGALWHIKDPAIKGPGVAVVGVVLGRAMNFKGHKMASFVGTVNDTYNKFFNIAKPVTGVEVEQAYKDAFVAIAERYARFNKGAAINTFIVYRQIDTDDDMFLICDKTNGELGYAQSAAKSLKAKLVYCIAVKRCSSRFFGITMGNPRAGTVIDQDVTLPNRFDFYMVSHTGRKGSVMPTYYFIVTDEYGLSPNQMQQFTFQMCHMYYNWSGTIKVPAVCQYAFKQATMCGEVTKFRSDERLHDKLWFLLRFSGETSPSFSRVLFQMFFFSNLLMSLLLVVLKHDETYSRLARNFHSEFVFPVLTFRSFQFFYFVAKSFALILFQDYFSSTYFLTLILLYLYEKLFRQK